MEDEDSRAFWAEQEALPLFKRDRMWWAEVGFSKAVVWAALIAFAVIVTFLL